MGVFFNKIYVMCVGACSPYISVAQKKLGEWSEEAIQMMFNNIWAGEALLNQ